MEITYYGANCLWFETKDLKILFDPFAEQYGLKLPKKEPDVVIYSDRQSTKPKFSEKVFVIDMPGEYELKNVAIRGIRSHLHTQKKEEIPAGIAYAISYDDVNFLVLGNLADNFNEEQTENLGDIHAMNVPVGGHGLTLDKEAAAGLVSQFDAGFVVPTHYNQKGINYPVPQDDLKAFLDEIGAESPEPQDKLKVTLSDLPEETQVVVLKIQS